MLQDLELRVTADLKHITFSCVRPYAKGVCRFFFLRGKIHDQPNAVPFFFLFFFSLGLLPICALAMGLLVFLKPKTMSSVGLLWSKCTSYIRGGIYPSPV